MIKIYLIFIFIIFIKCESFCQINNDTLFGNVEEDALYYEDTLYYSMRLIPRIGLNIVGSTDEKFKALPSYEFGLYLNKAYIYTYKGILTSTGFDDHRFPYFSRGFHISSEFIFRNNDSLIIGPKIGWEWSHSASWNKSALAWLGVIGAEFINYTDFHHYSPAFLFKIGTPCFFGLNFTYGRTLFLENSLKKEIGVNRFTMTYNFNLKAIKENKRLNKNFKIITARI